MNYRTLGRTGLEVSEIGYGAWGIAGDAWLGAKDEESLEALNRAVDLGLNFIDTALAYGEGHSERLVGKIVEERTRPSTSPPRFRRRTGSGLLLMASPLRRRSPEITSGSVPSRAFPISG